MIRAAAIAERDVDGLYAEAGRLLGEGLHQEYVKLRRKTGDTDSVKSKLELYALVSSKGVLDTVVEAADALRKSCRSETHKAAMATKEEKYRQIWREIEGTTDRRQASGQSTCRFNRVD